MFYAETRMFSGRWSPVKFNERPEVRKDGFITKKDGMGPKVRGIKEISKEHEDLGLLELQKIYGTDPTTPLNRTVSK